MQIPGELTQYLMWAMAILVVIGVLRAFSGDIFGWFEKRADRRRAEMYKFLESYEDDDFSQPVHAMRGSRRRKR